MSPTAPTAPAIPALPPPVQNPTGSKPGKKPAQPSMISAGALPQATSGGASGKTLLGQ